MSTHSISSLFIILNRQRVTVHISKHPRLIACVNLKYRFVFTQNLIHEMFLKHKVFKICQTLRNLIMHEVAAAALDKNVYFSDFSRKNFNP
jgi:hypothetical protein